MDKFHCIIFVSLSVWPLSFVISEWIQFGLYEYLLSDNSLPWENASDECLHLNASLASVADAAESTFLIQELDRGSNYCKYRFQYWLGLRIVTPCRSCIGRNTNNSLCQSLQSYDAANSCCDCRKKWYWTDGTPMTFMRWSPHEPNNGNCARMSFANDSHPEPDEWFWFDYKCSMKYRFICKRQKGVTTGFITAVSDVSISLAPNITCHEPSHNSKRECAGKLEAIGIGIGTGIVIGILLSSMVFVLITKRCGQGNKCKHSQYVHFTSTAYPTGIRNEVADHSVDDNMNKPLVLAECPQTDYY